MDIQFYGANCLSINYKSMRVVVDDNLADFGKKNVLKPDDVALFTMTIDRTTPLTAKLMLDSPGEYEVGDMSIRGIGAQAHTDAPDQHSATMYKIDVNDIKLLITGHIYPQLSEAQLEEIGAVDVVVIPVGGHGYTLDPQGALSVIKAIEPKLIIPTNYADKSIKYPVPQLTLSEALKELGMEPKETMVKLKLKPTELSDVTQLVVVEIS